MFNSLGLHPTSLSQVPWGTKDIRWPRGATTTRKHFSWSLMNLGCNNKKPQYKDTYWAAGTSCRPEGISAAPQPHPFQAISSCFSAQKPRSTVTCEWVSSGTSCTRRPGCPQPSCGTTGSEPAGRGGLPTPSTSACGRQNYRNHFANWKVLQKPSPAWSFGGNDPLGWEKWPRRVFKTSVFVYVHVHSTVDVTLICAYIFWVLLWYSQTIAVQYYNVVGPIRNYMDQKNTTRKRWLQ